MTISEWTCMDAHPFGRPSKTCSSETNASEKGGWTSGWTSGHPPIPFEIDFCWFYPISTKVLYYRRNKGERPQFPIEVIS